MNKAFKFRVYPTKEQEKKLFWTLERCRELYNAGLTERRDAYNFHVKHHPGYYDEETRKRLTKELTVNYYQQKGDLPFIKAELREEYQDIHSQVLQDVLLRLKKAFDTFFRRVHEGAHEAGYPRFKGKNRYESFTYPQEGGFSLTDDSRVCLSKIGSLKVNLHRPLEGTIKTCTVKQEAGQWYVVFSCEVEAQAKLPYTNEAIGIDLGLLHFAALSTGDTIENPRTFRKGQADLKRKQRHLARCKRRSHRREKARKQVAKAHRNIRNQRHDFLHKQARQLVNTYETIVFEDLQILNMSKAPKPKQDENGNALPNGSAAKGGLNKSIRDAGWGTFVQYCRSKAEEAGTIVGQVDPYKTSQICSACGEEGTHKDLSVRTHTCLACGVVLDRDHNAALNILSAWERPTVRSRSRGDRKRTVEAPSF